MANANLCMFVNAHTCVLGLNERYVMCKYIAYVSEQNLQWQRERERERDKAQEIKPYFFLKGAVCKKQDHSLQSSVWVKSKNIFFKFDIVLKSVVGMH